MAMNDVAFYVEHPIVYSNKEPLPVQDVVDSLLAMKKLSQRILPGALSALTGSKISAIHVLVDGFEHGSFKESFLLGFVFPSEKSFKRFQKAVRELDFSAMYKELPLKEKPVLKAVAVSVAIAALVSYAVTRYAAGTASPERRALIEANNNVIVAIGAEAYNLDPEAFAKALALAVKGKEKPLASAAAGILAPAHREPGATVSMDKAVISHDAVIAMPTAIDDDPYEMEQAFENASIDIRQMNRDSATSGWRGRIADQFDDRVKLTLGDGIRIEDLAGKLEVKADVTVLYRKHQKKNTMMPVEIIITALRPQEAPGRP